MYSFVVVKVNVIIDELHCIPDRSGFGSVNTLILEQTEKALSAGVIIRATYCRHGRRDPVALCYVAIRNGCVLKAVVTVQDWPIVRASVFQRRMDRIRHQLRRHLPGVAVGHNGFVV